jgi:hypothetical protein
VFQHLLGHLSMLRFLVLLLCLIQRMDSCFAAIAKMRDILLATSANYLTLMHQLGS